MGEPRTIKKYPNRRLYDASESRYVTLTELQGLVNEGLDFVVVENATGADITRPVLLQLLIALEEQNEHLLSRECLLQLLRSYGKTAPGLTATQVQETLALLISREGKVAASTRNREAVARMGHIRVNESPPR